MVIELSKSFVVALRLRLRPKHPRGGRVRLPIAGLSLYDAMFPQDTISREPVLTV